MVVCWGEVTKSWGGAVGPAAAGEREGELEADAGELVGAHVDGGAGAGLAEFGKHVIGAGGDVEHRGRTKLVGLVLDPARGLGVDPGPAHGRPRAIDDGHGEVAPNEGFVVVPYAAAGQRGKNREKE